MLERAKRQTGIGINATALKSIVCGTLRRVGFEN